MNSIVKVLLSMISMQPIGNAGPFRPKLPVEEESRPHPAGPRQELGEIDSSHHGPHVVQFILVYGVAHT
jgi:hypothetical protein